MVLLGQPTHRVGSVLQTLKLTKAEISLEL